MIRRMPMSCRNSCAAVDLRAVYHGSSSSLQAEGTDANLSERGGGLHACDAAAQGAVPCSGHQGTRQACLSPDGPAEWLAKLADDGARFRAEILYAQLDVLRELRPKAKAAMVAEARRDPAWAVLRKHPVPWAGAGRSDLGHHADTLAVPDEAESLGLLRAGGGDPDQLGLRVGEWAGR